jgi:hypothetical protein
MTAIKRKIFLDSFFRLFNVIRIKWVKGEFDKVFGTVIFSDNDRQDFCWHMTEDNVPSEDVVELIKIINDNDLIDVDKIMIKSEDLFKLTGWNDKDKFKKSLNDLFEIEVRMIDNKEETDSFFIHE